MKMTFTAETPEEAATFTKLLDLISEHGLGQEAVIAMESKLKHQASTLADLEYSLERHNEMVAKAREARESVSRVSAELDGLRKTFSAAVEAKQNLYNQLKELNKRNEEMKLGVERARRRVEKSEAAPQ